MTITILIGAFGIIMLAAAVYALYSRDLVSAILASGAISLTASVIYLLLAAPDVAMTEAAIGSALTTVVFLYALKRVRNIERSGGAKKEAGDV